MRSTNIGYQYDVNVATRREYADSKKQGMRGISEEGSRQGRGEEESEKGSLWMDAVREDTQVVGVTNESTSRKKMKKKHVPFKNNL